MNPFLQLSQFLAHGGSLENFRNCEGLHTTRLAVFTQACFFASWFSVVSLVRMWGMAVTGRGVVRASHIHFAKISSEES